MGKNKTDTTIETENKVIRGTECEMKRDIRKGVKKKVLKIEIKVQTGKLGKGLGGGGEHSKLKDMPRTWIVSGEIKSFQHAAANELCTACRWNSNYSTDSRFLQNIYIEYMQAPYTQHLRANIRRLKGHDAVVNFNLNFLVVGHEGVQIASFSRKPKKTLGKWIIYAAADPETWFVAVEVSCQKLKKKAIIV